MAAAIRMSGSSRKSKSKPLPNVEALKKNIKAPARPAWTNRQKTNDDTDELLLVQKIEKLRNEFADTTEVRRLLEIQFNEDEDPKRVREVQFDLMKSKENVPALERRLDTVEEVLALTDIKGLERQLVENHVTKLANDSMARAMELKRMYSSNVRAKVTIRKNLGLISREIEGLTCENSISQAQAELAENLYNKLQEEVTQAELNFAYGRPPTKEIEMDWCKYKQRQMLLRRAYKKSDGFLRKADYRKGYEINVERLRPGRRQLENQEESVLGWSFSADYKPMISQANIINLPNGSFYNSAINPKSGCQTGRNKKFSKQGPTLKQKPKEKETKEEDEEEEEEEEEKEDEKQSKEGNEDEEEETEKQQP